MNKNTNTSDDQLKNTPESIVKLLTSSAAQLDTETVSALSHARHVALERQSLHQPVFAFSSEYGTHRLIPHSTQQWMATIMLLVALLVSVASYWHHESEQGMNQHDMSYLDIAILTNDLPMEIFVDR